MSPSLWLLRSHPVLPCKLVSCIILLFQRHGIIFYPHNLSKQPAFFLILTDKNRLLGVDFVLSVLPGHFIYCSCSVFSIRAINYIREIISVHRIRICLCFKCKSTSFSIRCSVLSHMRADTVTCIELHSRLICIYSKDSSFYRFRYLCYFSYLSIAVIQNPVMVISLYQFELLIVIINTVTNSCWNFKVKRCSCYRCNRSYGYQF